jgi:hypothetical protein
MLGRQEKTVFGGARAKLDFDGEPEKMTSGLQRVRGSSSGLG